MVEETSFTAARTAKCYGGAGDDVIVEGADGYVGRTAVCLYGEGGNDSLVGAAGNDTHIGGVGNDTLFGGRGSDRVYVDTADADRRGVRPTAGAGRRHSRLLTK
jgi:Ca2+-binding RTX toxin-like protein